MAMRCVAVLLALFGFACTHGLPGAGAKPKAAEPRPAALIQKDLASLEALRTQKVDPGMLKLREDDPVSEVLGDQVDDLEKDRQLAMDRCQEILGDELKDPAAFVKVPIKVTKRDECLVNFESAPAAPAPAPVNSK